MYVNVTREVDPKHGEIIRIMPSRQQAVPAEITMAYEAWDTGDGVYDVWLNHVRNEGDGHCHIPKIKTAYEWAQRRKKYMEELGYAKLEAKWELAGDQNFETYKAIVCAPAQYAEQVRDKFAVILEYRTDDIDDYAVPEFQSFDSDLNRLAGV